MSESENDIKFGAVWAECVLLEGRARREKAEKADALWSELWRKFPVMLRLRPDDSKVLHKWAIVMDEWARTKRGDDATKLWNIAYEKYGLALAYGAKPVPLLRNWALSLCAHAAMLAEAQSPEVADDLWRQAAEKFEQAVMMNPENQELWLYWGMVLQHRALLNNGELSLGYSRQAEEKFARAQQIAEQSAEQAQRLSDEKVRRAHEDTAENQATSARIIEVDRRYKEIHNSARRLYHHAKSQPNERRKALLLEAHEKLLTAEKIKPFDLIVLSEWSIVLFDLIESLPPQEHAVYLHKARETLMKIEQRHPGRSAHNLACVAVRLGREYEARDWLEKGARAGSLSRSHLEGDADFDGIRRHGWFRELLSIID